MKETEAYKMIIRPIITEKGMFLAEKHNTYPFEVDPRANKIQVRQAIEKIYPVKVEKVHMINMHGKRRRVGRSYGITKSWKKAMVKLHEGDAIELI